MRPIDADALLEKMDRVLPMEDDISECVSTCARTARRLVAKAPTVDAVKHGRWKKNWHDNNLIGHEYEECSACGSCIISDTEKFWNCNYCPNCGARMDGAEDG